jgi:hypothetical protein
MVNIFPSNAKLEDQIFIIVIIKTKWPIMTKVKYFKWLL